MKLIASNKKAFFEYFIEDTFEAGIVLKGSEVKSVRNGNISLQDSFVFIRKGEVFLKNAYIKPYEKSTSFILDPRQDRKLLLNKSEIAKILKKVNEKGFTVVPTKVYFKKALVKVEIAVAKGKKLYDKRRVLAEKDKQRDLQIELKKYS